MKHCSLWTYDGISIMEMHAIICQYSIPIYKVIKIKKMSVSCEINARTNILVRKEAADLISHNETKPSLHPQVMYSC